MGTHKRTLELKGKLKKITKTEKKGFSCVIKKPVIYYYLFFEKLSEIKQHSYDIMHQYGAIKYLKDNLNPNEILFHIDFSENYSLKFGE